ncbi:hypothetical protein HY009_04420, partial [Candidatus Acetothermia bacterium]|nr:hypothetical protein [Candidatus Acetothermia bacterium]
MKHSRKPAPIPERLRKVLDLEKRSKYQDTAVDGGLEKFIIALARELEKIETLKPVSESLTQTVRNYANKPVPQRRAIVQNLEDELRALDAIGLPVPESTEQTSQPPHETRSLQS